MGKPPLIDARADRARERHLPGVFIAVATATLMGVYDVLAGPHIVLAGLLTVGPCLAAVSGGRRAVLAVGGYVILMLLLVSGPDRMWWTLHQLLYLLALVAVTAISAVVADRRSGQEQRLAVAQAQFTGAFQASTIGMALVSDSLPAQLPSGGEVAPVGTRPRVTLLAANPALHQTCRWETGPPPDELATLIGEPADGRHAREVVLGDGSVMLAMVTSTQLPVRTGGPDLRLVQIEDVTRQRRAEQTLTRLAMHDHLTGLAGRALLRDRLAHALHRCLRSARRVGVLFLDLDRFKGVNDSLGHDAGDALLLEVASRLTAAVRPEDTVARLGGDEFVVLLEEIHDVSEAEAVAGRVQRALDAPVILSGERVQVAASIGIAVSGDPNTDAEALLRDADTAMYHAKARGRARLEVFDDDLRRDAVERLEMESALRAAVENSELRIHLQPVVAPGTGQLLGAEALVRWQRPGRGLISPASFVPVAADCGLLGRIDAWVLGEAIRQAAWCRRERGDPDFYVSVNLSGAELVHSRLSTLVADQLSMHDLPADRLMIEVTESAYADAMASTRGSLQGLRNMNVRLALDNFGTGYSSLTYIMRYPFDVIKIDRSFIRGMLVDRVDAGIVTGMLSLAEALGLSAVAEGVETPQLAQRIADLKCPMGQGYTWCRPVPVDDFVKLPAILPAR